MARPIGRMTLTGLAVAACLTAAACAGSASPTPTSPEDPRALLDQAADALRGLTSVRYSLSHEEGGTDMGGGLELTSVEGEALFPDRTRLQAKVVLREFSVRAELSVVQVGERAFMQGPIGERWQEVELGSLPFLFAGMDQSMADALAAAEEVTLAGPGEVDGVPVHRLVARVPSEALRGLVPGAISGETLVLEVAVGQADALPRRIRIEGKVVDQDTSGMVRLLRLFDFDAPVTVEVPVP